MRLTIPVLKIPILIGIFMGQISVASGKFWFSFVENGSQIVLFRLQTSKLKVENRTRRGIKDEQSS